MVELLAPESALIRDVDLLDDELAVLHEGLGDVVHRRVREGHGVLEGGADHTAVVAVEGEDIGSDLEHRGDALGLRVERDAGGELTAVGDSTDAPGRGLLGRLDGLDDIARLVGHRHRNEHLVLASVEAKAGGDTILQRGEAVLQRARLVGSEHAFFLSSLNGAQLRNPNDLVVRANGFC